MDHVEFLVMFQWLQNQWNEPSRGDWYSMQTTAEIRAFRQSFSKHPKAINLRSFKLPFKFSGEEKEETFETMSPERAKQIEAVWFSRFGIDASGKRRTKADYGPGANMIRPKGTGVSPVRGEKKPPPPPRQRIDPRRRK